MSGRGRLIALEGVDGCGKSTQALRLSAHHRGAVDGGARRHATGRHVAHAAARSQPAPRVRASRGAAHGGGPRPARGRGGPARPRAGRWVVTERFSGSTLAYQGYGRGLDLDELRRLVVWAAGGIEPDLTILLDVAPALARGRRRSRARRSPGTPRRRLPRAGARRVPGPGRGGPRHVGRRRRRRRRRGCRRAALGRGRRAARSPSHGPMRTPP